MSLPGMYPALLSILAGNAGSNISRPLGITRWELRVCKTTIAELEAKVARLERKASEKKA